MSSKIEKRYQELATRLDSGTLSLAFSPNVKELVQSSEIAPVPEQTYLVACWPRSGSTFTTLVLRELLGCNQVNLCFAKGRSDHDLYVPNILSYWHQHTISQHHMRATEANLDLINHFRIRTVILVRDIFDAIASRYDVVLRDLAVPPPVKYDGYVMDSETSKLEPDVLMDFTIDSRADWDLNFFVSWSYALSRGYLSGLMVTYEQMIRDKVAYFRTILEHFEQPRPDTEIATAIEKLEGSDRIRLFKGEPGRGRHMMTSLQVERLEALGQRYRRYYPSADFSLVGL